MRRGAPIPPKNHGHAMAWEVMREVFAPVPLAVVSSELIPIQKAQFGESEVNAVSGRDLHAFLEVGKVFAAWMPEQIEAFGFVEGQDFEVCFPNLESEGRGGKNLKEYMISIPMAKELAMVQRTAKGKQARLYFIECERLGEMIAAQKETVGLNTGSRIKGRDDDGSLAVVSDDRQGRPTLADAGISKDLSSRAQKLAVRGCLVTGCRASHGVKPAPFLDEINPTSLDPTSHPLPGGGQ